MVVVVVISRQRRSLVRLRGSRVEGVEGSVSVDIGPRAVSRDRGSSLIAHNRDVS